MNCPVCQTVNAAGANYCEMCGAVLSLPATGPTAWLGAAHDRRSTDRIPNPAAGSSCPKCQGMMEQGFVPDEAYRQRELLVWLPGVPRRNMWTGKVRLDGPAYAVQVYRCRVCGFLEWYAHEPAH